MLDSKGRFVLQSNREEEEPRNVLKDVTKNPSNSYLPMLKLYLNFGKIGIDTCKL